MMNHLSTLVGGQRQAPASAVTPIWALALPPPLTLASGSGFSSKAAPLEARSTSIFQVGLLVGATGQGDYALESATLENVVF